MEINRLEIILELFYGKTLAEVAEKYSYTPSAISHMLKSMEADFGIKLFYRDRTGVTATPEGRAIFEYMESTVTAYRVMKQEADKLGKIESGLIRVGAFISVIVSWLPFIINSFKEEYPHVHFEILQGNYEMTQEWIQSGYIDCGFTIGAEAYEDLESQLISKDKLYLIYPKEHPLAYEETLDWQSLKKYPFISLNEGSEEFVMNYIKSHNIEFRSICKVMDDYAVVAMVESGMGISIVPGLFLSRVPYDVGSRCLDENFYRHIYISYKNNYKLSPLTDAFITHVKKWVLDNQDIVDGQRTLGTSFPDENKAPSKK